MKCGCKRLWVCIAFLGATLGLLYLSSTPRLGDKLPLKPETPRSVQVKFFNEDKSTSEFKLCAEVVAALRDSRGGGPPCLCPPLGSIILQYADGETNKLYLQPGHWIGRTDVIFDGRRYSMATGKLSHTIKNLGIQMNFK